MTEWMTMVRALVKAEEEYYLANGEYTDNFQALSVLLPPKEGCEFTSDQWCPYYNCEADDVSYAICDDASSVQGGTYEFTKYKLRYEEYMKDHVSSVQFYKGDRVCQAIGILEDKV